MQKYITVKGAHEHNLKNVSIKIPINRISVVTGLSGSGKSSLVIDTISTEGKRRYIETFSSYARQFLDRVDKPKIEEINGLLPSIAIEQVNPVKTSRSTVGTMTELSDYLKGAKCPVLNFHNKDEFAEAYVDFYTSKVLGA